MIDVVEPEEPRFEIRDLLRRGELTALIPKLTDEERRMVRAKIHEFVWPIVFTQLTRRLERNRGHHACASGIHRMEPACLDRFTDDVNAAVDYVMRNAKTPIAHPEGWISKRLKMSTIDGYRRRRGERGAQQRPRLPRWLVDGLDGAPHLTQLALDILDWVGVDAGATTCVWPVAAWAERRAATTHDFEAACRGVTADIETVLAVMRRRPRWFASYVERPLSHKQPPVVAADDDQSLAAGSWSATQARLQESDDARLVELAVVALDLIFARLSLGEEPEPVVREVLATVFGSGAATEELDRRPGDGTRDDEWVSLVLADPAAVDRVVALILDLLAGDEP